MEKHVFLAIFLSFVVLAVYQILLRTGRTRAGPSPATKSADGARHRPPAALAGSPKARRRRQRRARRPPPLVADTARATSSWRPTPFTPCSRRRRRHSRAGSSRSTTATTRAWHAARSVDLVPQDLPPTIDALHPVHRRSSTSATLATACSSRAPRAVARIGAGHAEFRVSGRLGVERAQDVYSSRTAGLCPEGRGGGRRRRQLEAGDAGVGPGARAGIQPDGSRELPRRAIQQPAARSSD